MDESLLETVVSKLQSFTNQQSSPAEALEAFSCLSRQRSLSGELLWERDASTGAREYGAVILRDEQVFTLQTHADRSMPWVMRDAIQWTDADVVRVNENIVRIEDLVAALEVSWVDANIGSRIVDAQIIAEQAKLRRITVDGDELQNQMNAFRQQRGLKTEDETNAWLVKNGLTQERLEKTLELQQLRSQLRHEVTHTSVTAALDEVGDLQEVLVSRVRFSTLEAAQEFFAVHRTSTLSEYVASGLREGLPVESLALRRSGLELAQSERLFTGQLGLVEPIENGMHFDVFYVHGQSHRRSDSPERVEALSEEHFEQWLNERKNEATIVWYWGPDSARR